MNLARASLSALLMLGACLAVDQPVGLPILPCAESTKPCVPGPKDLKDAKQAFSRAVKLQKNGRPEEAFPEFENAARLVPQNIEYLTAREMIRQQLVSDHLRRGNDASLEGNQ